MSASGQSSFSVTRNNIASPPFASTAAINGVSIKPVTGEVVLGNDVGAILATLISNREIPMATFLLRLLFPTIGQSITFQNDTNLDAISILLANAAKTRGINIQFSQAGVTATAIRMQSTPTNSGVEMDMVNDAGRGMFFDVLGTTMAGGDISRLQVTGNEYRQAVLTAGAFYRWFTGATQRAALLNNGNFRLAANNTDNTCRLQVDGAGSMDKLVFPKNITPYAINLNQDRDNFFTNEGASALQVFTLPSAAQNFTYTFHVQDADGLQVTAAAGDTIRIGGSVSAAAGNTSSVSIGSCIKLQCINVTEWVAVSVVGVWSIT